MKLLAFIFGTALSFPGPQFPRFPQDNQFFLEAAAKALTEVNFINILCRLVDCSKTISDRD